MFDVAILGGGAAGLMAAAWLREHTALRVSLIEGNPKLGAKIGISGGGKCNLTNVTLGAENYLGDGALVRDVLGKFDNEALLQWVQARGCHPVLRKERYYFCPKSAQELIDIFLGCTTGTALFLRHRILGLQKSDELFTVMTDKAELRARRVIVATGGVSYASVGATDVGVQIAEAFGIRVVPFRPALAGLTLQPEQFWMKALSGVSFPVTIRIKDKTLREDMLFTHRGISGPAVLSASLYWEKGALSIDFLAGGSLASLLTSGGNRKLSRALPLPRSFVIALLAHLQLEDKPCSRLTRREHDILCRLCAYEFAPAGTFGFSKAEVSKGGVACEELVGGSCESRRVAGLFFAGEVIDVTGELGGYNFQWAFASALSAAQAAFEGLNGVNK